MITPATLAGLDGPHVKILREAGFDITYPPPSWLLSEADLMQQLGTTSGVIAGSEPYTRRVLAAHPALRVIARAGVGYDAVDVEAATDHGVAVCIAPGTNQESVAEHAFALILALAKGVVTQHNGTRSGQWPRQTNLPLRGSTLSIAGLGRIGKAVAERGAAFSMRLLAHEPFPDTKFVQQYGITLVSMEKLLAEADFLSLHVPLTPESRHLINRKTLALMKPTSFLINTSRGGLVNEADLVEALRSGRLAGAGLDVFEVEPLPPGPLYDLENVVLTPHAAGTDLRSRDDMAASAARAIVALSRGQWPAEQIVNPQVRGKFKW
jgi:phosphoglycerate dehydrogenase-like enzyme